MDEPYSLPISALQHFMYCPRQCALIHIERVWQDNLATVEGQIIHHQVDNELRPSRGEVRYAHAMQLSSEQFHIHGVSDLVELHLQSSKIVQILPVEFKRGKPKTHLADIIQVCAQALCLEEMFQQPVFELALFYAKTKRRLIVDFDQNLRAQTHEIIKQTTSLILSGKLPASQYKPECQACSLVELCIPQCGSQNQQKLEKLFESSLSDPTSLS